MRLMWITLTVLTVTVSFAAGQSAPQTAKAQLKNVQGEVVGDAVLTEAPNGVLIRVNLLKGPAGNHAIHIHQTGKCDAPFTTAGGHFNPTEKHHGFRNQLGMHAGDLPNIQIPANGILIIEVFDPSITLKDGPNSLFDADGSAIIIHQGADDYRSDPAGNAGGRLVCGVITK